MREFHLITPICVKHDDQLVSLSVYYESRRSTVKTDSSYSFQFNEMARPAELEPAPFCLEVA
jgi:hypothetical protein